MFWIKTIKAIKKELEAQIEITDDLVKEIIIIGNQVQKKI